MQALDKLYFACGKNLQAMHISDDGVSLTPHNYKVDSDRFAQLTMTHQTTWASKIGSNYNI